MSPTATRRLLALHRWCGLLVSANLLVLTLTGLILVFHDEIDDALGAIPQASSGAAQIGLARALEVAHAHFDCGIVGIVSRLTHIDGRRAGRPIP